MATWNVRRRQKATHKKKKKERKKWMRSARRAYSERNTRTQKCVEKNSSLSTNASLRGESLWYIRTPTPPPQIWTCPPPRTAIHTTSECRRFSVEEGMVFGGDVFRNDGITVWQRSFSSARNPKVETVVFPVYSTYGWSKCFKNLKRLVKIAYRNRRVEKS